MKISKLAKNWVAVTEIKDLDEKALAQLLSDFAKRSLEAQIDNQTRKLDNKIKQIEQSHMSEFWRKEQTLQMLKNLKKDLLKVE